MNINEMEKSVQIKIVYYGCGMSGKTTSLKYLFKLFNREEYLTSIETTTGRTLFFDFGIIPITNSDWNIKLMVYSATGQDYYISTRSATLEGVDGLIFVIDSQNKYYDDNIRSWNELKKYLQEKFYTTPIILCLNKRDLPNIASIDKIKEDFNINELVNVEITETIALNGEGIFESFKQLFNKLKNNIYESFCRY